MSCPTCQAFVHNIAFLTSICIFDVFRSVLFSFCFSELLFCCAFVLPPWLWSILCDPTAEPKMLPASHEPDNRRGTRSSCAVYVVCILMSVVFRGKEKQRTHGVVLLVSCLYIVTECKRPSCCFSFSFACVFLRLEKIGK